MADLNIRSTVSVGIGGGTQGHDITRALPLADDTMPDNSLVSLPATGAASVTLWQSANHGVNVSGGANDFSVGYALADPGAKLNTVRDIVIRVTGTLESSTTTAVVATFVINRNTPLCFSQKALAIGDAMTSAAFYHITKIEAINRNAEAVQVRLQLYK